MEKKIFYPSALISYFSSRLGEGAAGKLKAASEKKECKIYHEELAGSGNRLDVGGNALFTKCRKHATFS